MIATYLRSSSIGTFKICEISFFLTYVLGIETPPNQKASYGSVVHKAAELLCLKKLALERSEKKINAGELGFIFTNHICDEVALKISFEYYKKVEQPHWGDSDFEIVQKSWNNMVSYQNGAYYPNNLKVIDCEQYFDFEIEEDWAEYKFWLPGDKTLEGRLAIKGTMDIITEPEPGLINYIDLKTGSRNDWTLKYPRKKEYQDFYNDHQLLLYAIALNKKYPDKQLMMTIFFINDGGAFELPFGNNELLKAKEMLHSNFEKIKKIYYPRRKKEDGKPIPRWCENTCAFQKIMYKDTNVNVCDYIHAELKKKKMADVVVAHADLSKIEAYGSGGGRLAK